MNGALPMQRGGRGEIANLDPTSFVDGKLGQMEANWKRERERVMAFLQVLQIEKDKSCLLTTSTTFSTRIEKAANPTNSKHTAAGEFQCTWRIGLFLIHFHLRIIWNS